MNPTSTPGGPAMLAKTYDPASVEAETYRVWLDENCFQADPAKPGEPYSIVIPPPNVTGALHLGHAINNTLQDILTRTHRMRGFNTVWIPGIDHAGIATQAVVEKQLKEVHNMTRHEVGRDALVERIWAWKQQYGDRILSQLQRLGCSCDWSRTRFTLDDMCAKAVRETFFKLFKDGLVYRGKRLVNWDTHLMTSISDDELYDEPVKTNLWSIKYPIDGTDDFVIVATTRPETMLADTAVAYHSSNPKATTFNGKSVRLPLTNRLVPLIEDDILVDPEFGTGYVKVTPAHDANDYAVYQRHLGKPTEIGILNLMTADGKVNDADPSWAQYAGLTFAQARKKIVEDLAAAGLHDPETDVKPHEANVKFSDRSKTAIQPYLSDQWFVNMDYGGFAEVPLASIAAAATKKGWVRFFPRRHAQYYFDWLFQKRDWPISRQLWWGHRIPVWKSEVDIIGLQRSGDNENTDSNKAFSIFLKFEGAELQTRMGMPVEEQRDRALAEGFAEVLYSPRRREDGTFEYLYCPAEGATNIETFLDQIGERDPDVLDTWFSSALWPLSTFGWPLNNADIRRWYPTSVLLTGRDIISLWVARMIMFGVYNTGQIPFRHVVINPTILDGKGERMSKSKGNGVDPVEIIDIYGADALRFTLTQMATETQDARMPVKKDSQGRNTSDKFDGGRNFCTKLWNAAKFVLMNLEQAGGVASATLSPPDESQWSLIDRWIVTRFNRTVEEANAALAVYRFDQYHKACYDFFWRDFCDWYVEAGKPAMRTPTTDPARQAQTAHVLASVLDGILRLMHPMIPFITERLWWQLNSVRPTRGLPGRLECSPSNRLIHATWPGVGTGFDDVEFFFPRMQSIIEAIRKIRNDYQINPKAVITVSIAARGDAKRQIERNREMIELLSPCVLVAIEHKLPAPKDAARATAAGVELFVEGLVDPEAEKLRVVKLIDTLEKKRDALRGRLANPSYADRAPAHLVQQTRDELTTVEIELAKLTG